MVFSEFFQFSSPTRIIGGPGAVRLSGEEALRYGCSKVLVITDPGIEKAGIVERVTQSISKVSLNFSVFSGVQENPKSSTIEDAVKAYRDEKADGIVSVGGGSSIDTAKAAGIMVNNPGNILDYAGVDKIKNPLPPLLAIPTTYGTGSEVSSSALIVDKDSKSKVVVASYFVAPKVALLDPELLLKIPAKIGAATGIDALTHAVESYLSLMSNPLSEGIALHAIKLISENLRKAVSNDYELQATEKVLIGSSMALMAATSTRLGNIHAMAHALGAQFNVHHGTACGLFLPCVMRFNLMACPEKFVEIARVMGERVEGIPLMEAAAKAIDAIERLLADLQIPAKLSVVGCKADDIAELAKGTMSGNVATNPRKTTIDDVIRLLREVL